MKVSLFEQLFPAAQGWCIQEGVFKPRWYVSHPDAPKTYNYYEEPIETDEDARAARKCQIVLGAYYLRAPESVSRDARLLAAALNQYVARKKAK